MMNRMIAANLIYRPIRSLISIVAIALEVTLILLIVGLSLGFLSDSRTRTAGIGADVLFRPPGSQFIAGFTGAPYADQNREHTRKTASCGLGRSGHHTDLVS